MKINNLDVVQSVMKVNNVTEEVALELLAKGKQPLTQDYIDQMINADFTNPDNWTCLFISKIRSTFIEYEEPGNSQFKFSIKLNAESFEDEGVSYIVSFLKDQVVLKESKATDNLDSSMFRDFKKLIPVAIAVFEDVLKNKELIGILNEAKGKHIIDLMKAVDN